MANRSGARTAPERRSKEDEKKAARCQKAGLVKSSSFGSTPGDQAWGTKGGFESFDRLSDGGSYATHEMKDYRDYSKNQKNVDEESCDMKDEKSA
jgi:hypothetical protein